jgi:2-oxo-4-hydroxy-4-carboxy--5-ureidoimidazoline (OHCU) decarboxylase
VVATKHDAASAGQRSTNIEEGADRTTSSLGEFKEFCERQGLDFHIISAVTGEGLTELLRAVSRRLDELKEKEEELKCEKIDENATSKVGS